MATEAFVCPHCRTWVEGSGRVVRCTSCGKRFRADEARLGQRRTSFEQMDYETPPPRTRDSAGFESDEDWDVPGWREPEIPTYSYESAPDYDTPTSTRDVTDSWEQPATSTHPTSEVPGSRTPEKKDEEDDDSPWGWIVGLATIPVFLLGTQFLSGELFALAFVGLIGVQWLLGRGKDK